MLFASVQFIFFFLPIVLFTYWGIKNKQRQNIFLLLASVLFYIWGEAWHISVLLITVVFSYFLALKIQSASENKKKKLLVFGVSFNLLLLLVFKYSAFIADTLSIPLKVKNVHLPLGISFFVFHAISYLIDVYREKIPAEKRFSIVSLYFFLFPHQIAGPIVRYQHFSANADTRHIKYKDIFYGIERFILGLGKKVLIANSVAKCADAVFTLPVDDLSFTLSWIGAICYTIQIYFDFSGYSDMAIGLARMFGYHFHENFNFPYSSKSVTDFWRRWHISLSSWFRDYLYIPLGGNRASPGRTYFNLAIVFLLCGFWHGANWTFIIWGLWHGTFLIIERLGVEKAFSRNQFLSHVWTLLVVMVGWVFFRAENLPHALSYIKTMFYITQSTTESLHAFLDAMVVLGMAFGILFSSGHLYHFIKKQAIGYKGFYESILVFIFFMSMARLAVSTFNPFIYYRF